MRSSRIFIVVVFLLISLSETYAFRSRRRESHVQDTLALSCRGVVETFSHVHAGMDERMDHYAKAGYTHYFYSPSDDRYSNAWGWKFLYNDNDRYVLKALGDMCLERGLKFVWTANPGDDFSLKGDDLGALINKFVMMYYDGVRSFAVRLPDNVSEYGIVRDSIRTVFVNRKLKGVDVFVLNDMASVSFPSEDDAVRTLMKGYHFDEKSKKSAQAHDAVLCVLRERSGLARTALAAAIEFAADPQGYDPDKAMEKGILSLSPEVKEPLMTFLEHTGGVGESKSVTTFTLNEWSSEKSSLLMDEFRKIEAVPAQMESCSSPSLLADLAPWLEEFGKLGALGCRTVECMDNYAKGDFGAFWVSFVQNRISHEDKESYDRHAVGKVKLYPFCIDMMNELTEAFSLKLGGRFDFKMIPSKGKYEVSVPVHANACRLLTGRIPEGETVLFRQLAADGSLVAEFVVTSPYSEYDLKEGAVSVDVLGDIDIYETIFVYL